MTRTISHIVEVKLDNVGSSSIPLDTAMIAIGMNSTSSPSPMRIAVTK